MPANRRLNRILLDVGTPVPIALPDNYVIFGYYGSMELLFTSTETTTDITWEQIDGAPVTYNTATTGVTKIDFTTSDLVKKKWRVYTNKGRAFERQAEGWFLHYPVDYLNPRIGNSTILDYPDLLLDYKYVKGLFTKAESQSFRFPTITATNQSGLLNTAFNSQKLVDSVFYMELYKRVNGSWVLDYTIQYYTHQMPIQDDTDYKIVVAYSDQGRYVEKTQIVLLASAHYRRDGIIDSSKAKSANSTAILNYSNSMAINSNELIIEPYPNIAINCTGIVDYVAQLQTIVATPISLENLQIKPSNSTAMKNYTVTLQTSTGVI
jgi:hypothetical protein